MQKIREHNIMRQTDGSWVFGGVVSKIEVGDHRRVATAEDYAAAKAIADHADSDAEGKCGVHHYDAAYNNLNFHDVDQDQDLFMFVVPDRTKVTLVANH